MNVEIVRPWRAWRPGQVLNIPDGQANEMIRRGIAEEVPESAELAIEVKRRGRPKKQ